MLDQSSLLTAMTGISGPWEAAFLVLMLIPLLFFTACVVYLWQLLLCAAAARKRLVRLPIPAVRTGDPDSQHAGAHSQRVAGAGEPLLSGAVRFTILIPAHNEELVLGAALDTLSRMDYPRDCYQVVVIADNCTDATAAIGRAYECAVLERFNTEEVGKGYALEWALRALENGEPGGIKSSPVTDCAEDSPDVPRLKHDYDAVVVLDADTLAASSLLSVFAQKLRAGDAVLQARYEVLNADETWRTRLMTCALALAHVVKPLGREFLKLSDGLKGNGMCFAREVVQRVPWSGESVTEDIEYTLRLCRAGYRVAFVPETAVWAQMPTSGSQSVSQRQRWEGGRYHLVVHVAPSLLLEGFRRRSRILRDRAVELIIPPFAEMFALPVLLLGASITAGLAFRWQGAWVLSALWLAVLLLQAGYLAFGIWVARVPSHIALTTLYAPVYIVWKLGVYIAMAVRRSAGGWKRTERRKLG